MTIVLRLAFVCLIAVEVRVRDTCVEEKVVHKVLCSSSVEHVSVLLLIVVIITIFIHIDIASSSRSGLILSFFLLVLPHLGDASREFLVDWNSHISILLNQYNAVVKVLSLQGNTQWCVSIYVLGLELSASLQDV